MLHRIVGVMASALLPPLLFLFSISAQSSAGLRAFEAGDYVTAAKYFLAETEGGGAPPRAWFYLGVSLLHTGKAREAERTLEHFVQLEPREAPGWTNLGICRFHLGRIPEAAKALQRSLELAPEQSLAEKFLGRCHVVANRHAEAERAFVRALQLEPGDFEAPYLLGRLYQTVGRLREAAVQLEGSLRLQPENARARAFLGSVYYGLGRMDEARQMFEQAIATNSRSGRPAYGPHLEFGIFLQRTGELERSVEQLRAAADSGTQDVECHFELARSLYRLSRLQEAKRSLLDGMKLAPGDPRLYYLLGRICYEEGDKPCGDLNIRRSEELRRQESEGNAGR